MGWHILSKMLGSDNQIAAGDVPEKYFDRGALFNILGCLAVSLAQNASLEIEVFGDDEDCDMLKLFNSEISTLSDRYNVTVYEMPHRDLAGMTTGTDYSVARVFRPNRRNLQDFPLDVVRLLDESYDIVAWDNGANYADEAYVRHEGIVYQSQAGANTGNNPATDDGTWWEAVGTVVDIKQFLMEEKGGPQASDGGGLAQRSTKILMNTEEHNYVLVVTNLDTAVARDFSITYTLGVPDLVR